MSPRKTLACDSANKSAVPEEVAAAMHGPVAAREVMNFLYLATASGFVRHFTPQVRFRIIAADLDDNIITDYAVAAEYIITEDRHFGALRNAGDKPQPITPEEFILHFSLETLRARARIAIMKVADIKEVVERDPFRPFAVRLNNGAQYTFNSPREIGATQEYNMVFYFGKTTAARIDADSIVEIIEASD